MLHSYRDWLVMEGGDELEEAARRRTVDLFIRTARMCVSRLSVGDGALAPRHGAQRDPHTRLVEEVASQLYFASGAFRAGDSAPLSDEVTARFYSEMRELLVELGTCGVISAANKVLETFEYFLGLSIGGIDRRDALERFLRVGEATVRAGAADSYWLLDPIENVLRRCVAEQDQSLTDETILASWSRVLDPLINLGWEQAYRLARDVDLSR